MKRLRLLLTRPDEASAALAQHVQARGWRCVVEAMQTPRPTQVPVPDINDIQAVLITSAQSLANLQGRMLPRDLPILCVGDATAQAARSAGFRRVRSADGDVKELAALAALRLDPRHGALLHLCALTAPHRLARMLRERGFEVRRWHVYRVVETTSLSPSCRRILAARGLDAALFFSPRAAATFVRLVLAHGLEDCCTALRAYALSPAVAAALAPLPWRDVVTARRPRQDSLLASIESYEDP
ncbi:MAG: uroporphyrinogen-III synthase [Alphaproteobacteria bacterium]|nr:MAG: uroporphyrinogen-III synthase [Alphaproteobacteria bacterium]